MTNDEWSPKTGRFPFSELRREAYGVRAACCRFRPLKTPGAAGAFDRPVPCDSGSKLRALHTLRAAREQPPILSSFGIRHSFVPALRDHSLFVILLHPYAGRGGGAGRVGAYQPHHPRPRRRLDLVQRSPGNL